MTREEKIVLLVGLILYAFVQMTRYFHWASNSFILYHLSDLVCMPIVFILIKFILKKTRLFPDLKRLPLFAIIALTVYWAWYFEFYLPGDSAKHTADLMDVGMYFIGSASYFLFDRFVVNSDKQTKPNQSSL